MSASHYGVIYDAVTLAVRRVIVPHRPSDLDDGTHRPEHGEVLCKVERKHIEHLIPDLGEIGREAIRRHIGKEPPTMEEVHATDRLARASYGGGGGRAT